MKHVLLAFGLTLLSQAVFGQNINDHKVSFHYVQLPLIKIDPQFEHYNVTIEHAYNQANADSIAQFEAQEMAAMNLFKTEVARYYQQRDSLDKIHLTHLSTWEKNVNAGVTNADGTPLERPTPPQYPMAPSYPNLQAPILHSEYSEDDVQQRIQLAGYEKGSNEIEVTITIHPIRNMRVVTTKKGTGTATTYSYTTRYILPIALKVVSPTQGILVDTTLFETEQSYKMRDQKSQYDHELYMMENREVFFRELEAYARAQALTRTNNYLNSQFGFVEKTRVTEIYSVKSFKGYDYTDVTNAFTKTNAALQAIGNDRDRSDARDAIQDAMNAIKGILEESNLSDNKSRINDKITAMLQCNLIELYIWQAEFDKAEATKNITLNSGEGKAKRHLQDQIGFYADQRKRWEANY